MSKEKSHKGSVMPRFLFRYKCLDENFKVEIEAENLNKAMFKFATYYHQIQEIYSVVRVPLNGGITTVNN